MVERAVLFIVFKVAEETGLGFLGKMHFSRIPPPRFRKWEETK